MELLKEQSREFYNSHFCAGAKFFALVKDNKTQALKDSSAVLKLCERIYLLETAGDLQSAFDILVPYSKGFKKEVDLTGLEKIEAANLLLRMGSVLSTYGNIHQVKDSQEMSRNYLSLGERLFEDLEINEGVAQCQNKIGVTFWRNGDIDTALIYWRATFALSETAESKAISYLNIGLVDAYKFNYSNALENFERAYAYIGDISDFTEGKIRNEIGIVYKNLGNAETEKIKRETYFDRAIIELEGAIVSFDEIKNKRLAILVRNNLAILYRTIKNFRESIQILEIAKTQAYQLRDKSLQSIITDSLANCYLDSGNPALAVANAATSVLLLESMENSNLLGTSLITYGTSLAKSGKLTKAKEMFERAETVAAFIQDSNLLSLVRLFKLLALYFEIEKETRHSHYQEIVKHLNGIQDREISKALDTLHFLFNAENDNQTVTFQGISEPLTAYESENFDDFSLDEKLNEIARQYIVKAIEKAGGNQSNAASLLGMSRQTFIARIKKDFPDLLPDLKRIAKKKKRVRIFRS